MRSRVFIIQISERTTFLIFFSASVKLAIILPIILKKNPQSSSQPLSKRTKCFAWLLGSKSIIGYDIDFQFICNELENLIPKLSTGSVAKNCLICVYKCNVCVVLYVYSSTTPTPY